MVPIKTSVQKVQSDSGLSALLAWDGLRIHLMQSMKLSQVVGESDEDQDMLRMRTAITILIVSFPASCGLGF